MDAQSDQFQPNETQNPFTHEETEEPRKEYDTWEEAMSRAGQAASMNYGRCVPGIMYEQANRTMVTTSLPIRILTSIVRRDSAARNSNPAQYRNRPLTPSHVKKIVEYLRSEQSYLMPPIMLNSMSKLDVFLVKTKTASKPGVFVLPPDEYLYVTDGQHRLEALRQALEQLPNLGQDAIGVTIVEEPDIDKVHQDFYDAAQCMPLSKALLVEYDGREPINWISREITLNAVPFKGRIEKIGASVGKNSLMMFTTNQVKQGIVHLLVGDWTLYGEAMQQQARQMLEPAKELWRNRIINFLAEFTAHNAQWEEVRDKPLESGQSVDVPEMRARYIHFTGAGLLILCGVGHSILEMGHDTDGELNFEQKEIIKRLANIDWSRGSRLWAGNVIRLDKITAQKNNVALAVAKVKNHLDMPITERESEKLVKSMEEAQAPEAQAVAVGQE
ncbi:MAG: DNA sulfur modification protein DndB [Candidatus Tectomicrobia bacterium]|nr:DNA sulfur modification protein DndB [Candidatus Tectomicrobia bacterium]